eukprot:TRINITY_DN748_c0_g1_i19.p3 TRINITY_DN748_c0_g1~~TRINITY_DN748_c0_g1_i19.p3  ORF type:complete len:102 (-),score=5.30 TRINITY_DN748_c0_g1_i19:27-332(-)
MRAVASVRHATSPPEETVAKRSSPDPPDTSMPTARAVPSADVATAVPVSPRAKRHVHHRRVGRQQAQARLVDGDGGVDGGAWWMVPPGTRPRRGRSAGTWG